MKAAVACAAMVAGITLVTAAPALANAANPDPDTTGTAMVNPDGSVTANLSGTWTWAGQNCAGRYGEGWAVDWWGISSSQTPANSFSLTNATEVTAPGVTTTGTISPAGAIPIHNSSMFFHVPAFYGGETVNSASTCTDSSTGSSGSWSATATYPSMSDVPAQVCVNMYDEHGNEGKPSGSASDFSPVNDNDNSIQTNNFDPTAGAGYCVALKVIPPPSITLVKQICKVAASKCDKTVDADWTSAHEVPSGATAVWRITVGNNGGEPLSNVTVTDARAPGCAGQISASLAAGASAVTTCHSANVTKAFTNTATVTGTPPSGANVTATGSAKVTVLTPPAGISINKQVCRVAAAKCSKSVSADWVKSHEVISGSTVVWRITVTNSGARTLSGVTIADAKVPGCAGVAAPSLAPGASVVETCSSTHVTTGFRNVATVTGAPPSGANVTATSSASVSVLPKPPGITTSQSLTPNDEGFVNNGQEATGKMTFKLYPPSDPTCSGTPAFQQTVKVAKGIGLTTNTTFIATQPGTWRWLVTYSGDATHHAAKSACGVESFTLKNK